MFPFGRKKNKKKLEIIEREKAELIETIQQKDVQLTDIKEDFQSYKYNMDSKLIKKEEIIRKLGERWDSLETNFMRREEELSSRLNEMNNTQRELIHKLKKENSFKTNAIDRQREYIERQNDKIKLHEDGLNHTKKELEGLKGELHLREDIIQNYLVETKNMKEQIENFEKEISHLNMKINNAELELEDKTGNIKKLEFELNGEKTKNRALEVEKEEKNNLIELVEIQKNEILKYTKLSTNIEHELKETKNLNATLKKELEEKNKLIAIYTDSIDRKENFIRELQLTRDNTTKDMKTKLAVIETLEFKNEILERECSNKEKEHSQEKRKMEESINELKAKILENEMKLKMRDETNGKLDIKLKDLEQLMTDTESRYEKELQNSKNQFRNMVHSKNTVIDSLEASQKRAYEKLTETNETIKRLENEMKRADLHFSHKEVQINEFKMKLGDALRENEVLQYKVDQLDLSKNQELHNIETIIKDQIKLANEAYQKEREIHEHRANEFIRDLEIAMNKQMGDLESSMNIIDDMQQNVDQFVISVNKKIETCTIKMKESKIHNESLEKMVCEGELKNRELKEDLVRKDIVCDELKKQMAQNLKLLQTELLKSEIGPTMSGLNNECYDDDSTAPIMENILRQIHTRNVVMTELREEKQTKHDALVRIQEKYQKLSDKIKRVVITVTNAKFAFHELEKENKILKQSLKRKYEGDKIDIESRLRDTKTRTLLESYSEYDIHEGKDSNSVSNSHQHCPTSAPLHTICEELESIREKSRKQILKLGLHTGLEKNIEHLKAEVQRERKLRKRQEALFTSVFSTLKTASACSQPAYTDYGDSALSES